MTQQPQVELKAVCRLKAVREGRFIVCHVCGYKEFA